MNKKTKIALIISSLCAVQAISANEFKAVIMSSDIKYSENVIKKAWSSWENVGIPYNCADWTPDESLFNFGEVVEQERVCDQDQEREQDYYIILSTNEEEYYKTETEYRTIEITEEKEVLGLKDYVTNEKIGSWSSWSDITSVSCDNWSPSVSTIDYGVSFNQTRNCTHDEERTRDIYDVWYSGKETFNRTETEIQTISEQESQAAIGTKNFTDTERADNWSSWSNNGVHYNCATWNPDASTVSYGDSFSQTRDCDQNQTRSRDVYDVWADGTETFNRTETENQIIIETESQNAVGSKNFIDRQRNDTWSSWSDTSAHYDCDTWSPNVSTVPYGDSFTQTRDCSQDQERTRNVYDVWADGSETLNHVETDNQTITETESQNAIGNQNFINTERADNWSSWSNTGIHYDCDTWNPNVSTVPYGNSFTQTRDCSQDQIRSRDVYDVWADGSESLNRVEIENQTISEQESQSAVGNQNFIENEREESWSNWIDSSAHYNCDTWTPDASTIAYGDSFTQTRNCDQDQYRTKDIYNVWADGTETFNRTETENKTIIEQESQAAIGTKNFISTQRNDTWSSWTDKGTPYDCTIWTPDASTVPYGNSFNQSRDCSQDQERTRNVYDVWADGSETLNSVETGNQTITNNFNQNAIGTDNYKMSISYGDWSNWTDVNSTYNCGTWTPDASTINMDELFLRSRSCDQDQERARSVYDEWADGTQTFKETETETQTVSELDSEYAYGTKNYIISESYGDWSDWSNTTPTYDCTDWTPDTSTVNDGEIFTQSSDCKQDQERSRYVYNDWYDGTQTVKELEKENKTISKNKTRTATGTKMYVVEQKEEPQGWEFTSGQYDCTDWTPDASDYYTNQNVHQTNVCQVDQKQEIYHYDVYNNGQMALVNVTEETRTVEETNYQSVKGTKPISKKWQKYQSNVMITVSDYLNGVPFEQNGWKYYKEESNPAGTDCNVASHVLVGAYYRPTTETSYGRYLIDLYQCK